MNVYLDEIFAINALTDFLLLLSGEKMAGEEIPVRRRILAAILGGIYSVVMVFPSVGFAATLFARIIFSFFMVFAAVGKSPAFFRVLGGFYVSMFIFGGIVIFLMNMGAKAIIYGGSLYFDFPMYKFVFVLIICSAVSGKISRYFRDNLLKKGITCEIKIQYGEKFLHTTGVLDTGNFLKDPISGKYVAAADCAAVEELFCADFCRAVESGDFLTALENEKAFLIPYGTIDKNKGIMVSVTPTLFEINGKTADVVLGIVPGNGRNIVINPQAAE